MNRVPTKKCCRDEADLVRIEVRQRRMKFAIQEAVLPGGSVAEKFQQARALGFDGVEVWSRDLSARMEPLVEALIAAEMPIAAVYMQAEHAILAPDEAERERGLQAIRDTICCAADVGAAGVICMPGDGMTAIPDLSPYMTAYELATGLFYTHMRTLEDYSMAMGVKFYIQPVSRSATRLIRQLDQAADILHRLHDHPNVQIAADTAHMAVEEHSLIDALTAHAGLIGYLHAVDSERRLPGQGALDFGALGAALKASNYDGWVTLGGGEPYTTAPAVALPAVDLAQSLAYLQQRGW